MIKEWNDFMIYNIHYFYNKTIKNPADCDHDPGSTAEDAPRVPFYIRDHYSLQVAPVTLKDGQTQRIKFIVHLMCDDD